MSLVGSAAFVVGRWENGEITGGELLNGIWQLVHAHPIERTAILEHLEANHFPQVRDVAAEIRAWMAREESLVKDVQRVRATSPLQPGTRLHLFGGYDAAYSEPAWLNGRKYRDATFVDFLTRAPERMPVAFVELDDAVDMTEGSGLRHAGKFALLKLLYAGDTWAEEKTVAVHIVETRPEDAEAFYASHPFGTEIESHATYRVAHRS